MKLNKLPKTTTRKKKRVGRGYGSGKGGHTVGRGSKGQKARGKVKIWFEGGQLPLVRKLPKTRGKGRFKPLKASPIIINLKDLANLAKNTQVTIENLAKAKIIKEKEATKFGVKILGEGEIKIPLTIKVPISKKAKEKIEKSGGKVE